MKQKELTYLEKVARFLKPAFSMKKISIKAAVPVVLWSVISIITIFLLKEITNDISNWFTKEILNLLYLFIGLILSYYIIVITTRNRTQVILWPYFRKYMYKEYINKYTYLDNNESEKIWTGKLIAMIDKGMMSWVQLLVVCFEEVLPNLVFIIFSFIFIFFINIYYFYLIFFTFILVLVLTYFFQWKAKEFREERRDINIWITKTFVKILMAKFEILQNDKEKKEWTAISDRLERNFYLNAKVNNFNIITEILVKLLVDWSKILIIIMFWVWLWNNVLNFWEFVALMSIVYVLDQILNKSISTYITFTKLFVDIEKIWFFFDKTPQIQGYHTWKEFMYKKWSIKIQWLSFWYSNNKWVFDDFDLDITWGTVTAFVGNSGSGKSTLVKLIAWYIRANAWKIIIDGHELNNTSLKSYYKNIGYLTQDPSVFDWTILENLTYAIDRELKKWELDNILKEAKCEFIYDLLDWVDTQIWERWIRLSWGQKQRLAIAKIFLKNPKIIILDEPTSALDSFSEEQITKAMHNLFKNRTVIIIAHRLQTVKNAKEIILFENWEIKERGSHDELVKLNWRYAEMLKLQSGF